MTDPNPVEAEILDWLAEREAAMLALLAELVDIDSNSFDKPGVDRVGARLREVLAGFGIATETIPSERFGDAILTRVGPAEVRPFLLMGHRDTVFPPGETARRPFRIDGPRAYGPGVADMKAGLVMNAFVLAALGHFAGDLAVAALFTGDEEIGSPFSRAVIEDEARRARAVFNAEPGRPTGNVVVGRKGGLFLRLDVFGKAAHSGVNFAEGASAVGELAHKIVALHALTDLEAGITVNVGTVAGGQSVNTVAPHAHGLIDARYVSPEQRGPLMEAIERIVARCGVAGTRAELVLEGEFLPLATSPETNDLMAAYRGSAADLGIGVEGEFTGGCADSGFAASVGTPTLCGLGPVGGKAHTADEYVEVASLVPRAQMLALTLLRLGRTPA